MGGGWALVGLGPLGEFKKRNSIGWQLGSWSPQACPSSLGLRQRQVQRCSQLIPNCIDLLLPMQASVGCSRRPLESTLQRGRGRQGGQGTRKKEQQQYKKKHKHAQPHTHTHWQRNTRVACTGTALSTYRRRTREGGRGGAVSRQRGAASRWCCRFGHGCGGRCCLVAKQVCSHRFLARIPAMPIWIHVHNTDMNTHTHNHTGLAETDPGAPCFAATTACTPCWQQAKKSVWGGRYFVGTKVPTGAEQQNGNEILHFENNRILPTVCCLSKV